MQSLLARATEALATGEYDSLPDILDQAELEGPAAFDSPQWPHSLHLMSHIYSLRLEDARFLYKRLPSGVKKSDAAVNAGFALLQCLWNKEYEAVWPALAFPWPEQLQGLAAALRARQQQRVISLVERAYTDLAPSRLAALMGSSDADAARAAVEQGWEVDASSGLILVKPKPAAPGAAACEKDLQHLAEYVIFLDS